MSIRYSLTLKEYYRYQGMLMRRLYSRSPLVTGLFIAVWALILIAPWATDYYVRQHTLGPPMPPNTMFDLILDAIPVVGPAAVFVLFMPLAWFSDRQNFLEIGKEGIALKLGRATGHSPWSAINRLDQDDNYIYIGSKGLSFGKMIMTSYNDPAMKTPTFAMLPKRAFPSPDEAQAFFEQAMAYWRNPDGSYQQSKGAWPPPPRKPSDKGSR